MATKPATLPRWAKTVGNVLSSLIVEPPSSLKDTGWSNATKPPAKFQNWWQENVYEWIQYLDDLHSQAFTWTALHVFNKKVTITAGVASNHAGVVATGDGSGAGVDGKGGDTVGTPGVKGTGGNGGGVGVRGIALGVSYAGVEGTGAGTGAGVKGSGGSSDAPGIEGTGGGAGAGIKGVGGASGASGVTGLGTNNNPGGSFTGHGGAPGVTGTGGTGDGNGGSFTGGASNANGLTGTGTGVGTGVIGSGGASGSGVYASGNGGMPALIVASGHAAFTGTQPAANATPAHDNLLTAVQIPKAQLMLHKDGAGVAHVLDGYNIDDTGFTVNATYVEVTMLREMADLNYGVTVTNQDVQNRLWSVDHLTKTTSTFRLVAREANTGSLIAPNGATVLYAFIEVRGRQ